jgi:hypothetical protein
LYAGHGLLFVRAHCDRCSQCERCLNPGDGPLYYFRRNALTSFPSIVRSGFRCVCTLGTDRAKAWCIPRAQSWYVRRVCMYVCMFVWYVRTDRVCTQGSGAVFTQDTVAVCTQGTNRVYTQGTGAVGGGDHGPGTICFLPKNISELSESKLSNQISLPNISQIYTLRLCYKVASAFVIVNSSLSQQDFRHACNFIFCIILIKSPLEF